MDARSDPGLLVELLERRVSRRDAGKQLAAVLGLGVLAGCTPARIAFGLYPREVADDRVASDAVLRAWVETVVPGASRHGLRHLTRVFYDRNYPFARFRGFLVADLCNRAHRLFAQSDFAALKPELRARVLRNGMTAGGTTERLYRGAVYLTQIAILAGIYDDENGCSLIDFHGRSGLVPLEAQTYADAERFLARELTTAGNPG